MYATAEEVKRLLRIMDVEGNNQYKIRFSNSFDPVRAYQTNQGSGVLKSVTINPSYAGSELWHIDFGTPVAFTLYRGEDTTIIDGTGNIAINFQSSSKVINIKTTDWGGIRVAGDKFRFRTNSNISDDDVAEFIDDSDSVVDGMLGKVIGPDHVPFDNPNVTPKLIIKGSSYIAANLIYTSVFSNLSTDQLPTLVRRWYNFGRDLVNIYLETIGAKDIRMFSRYSRFLSRQPLFDKVGILETAGVEGLYGEINTRDVEYDKDYNTKEQIGAT